jgi:prevent-host-death family protein
MARVGVRELRQRASRVLQEVDAGTTFEVTSRGRTIAHLVPAAHRRTRDRLIAQARLTPAIGDVLALGAPLRPARRAALPSRVLARARAHER